MNNTIQEKQNQILLGLYKKEYWDQYQFRIIELFTFDRFFNWALSGQMIFIEEKNTRFYLLDYKYIAPSWGMSIILLKKIMLHLSGSLKPGITTMLKFPLMRITKQNNNVWKTYYGFEKGVMNNIIAFEVLTPKRKMFIEEFLNMNTSGFFSSQDLIALNPPKYDKTKILCRLAPNVESILIELNELKINDKKKLFSFTLPTDHNIHTDSMRRFQSSLQDLFLGIFEKNHKINEKFIERNSFYINDRNYKLIKECKNNWDKIKELVIESANHYLTWFEIGKEPQKKDWLTRDIGTYIFDPMNKGSMFLVTMIKDSTSLREVIAEKTFNNLPSNITNLFQEFYKDEWDGLTYWNKIYSVYKWYKDNAKNLMAENINYSYWLDKGINDFMQEYYDFINVELGIKYLKHFGTKCATWNWFISSKKEEHGIDE